MKKNAQKTMSPGIGTKSQKALKSYEWEEEDKEDTEPKNGGIKSGKGTEDLKESKTVLQGRLSKMGAIPKTPQGLSKVKENKPKPDITKKKICSKKK